MLEKALVNPVILFTLDDIGFLFCFQCLSARARLTVFITCAEARTAKPSSQKNDKA